MNAVNYMNKNKIIWGIALLLAGCTQEMENQPQSSELRINVGVNETRVTQGNEGYTFDTNDEIGVFVSPEGQSIQTADLSYNVKNRWSGSEWVAEHSMYWTSDEVGTKDKIVGYYPYAKTVSDPAKFVFTVSSDQSTTDKMQVNDFLYGSTVGVKTTENAPVSFSLDHKMTRLTVNVKYSTQFTGTESISSFKINALPAVSIDLNTGTLGKASGTRTAISLGKAGKVTEGYRSTYDVIIVPQSVSATDPLLTLSINGQELRLTLAKEFESGKHYVLNLTAGKERLELTGISVSDWTTGKVLVGEVVEEQLYYKHGDVIPYMVNRTQKPVTIVFVGDGFTIESMKKQNGFYNESLDKAIKAIFNTEPYKTYQDYFNVYKIVAVSAEEGADNTSTGDMKDTFFGAGWNNSYSDMKCDHNTVFNFVQQYCPDIVKGQTTIDKIAIIVVVNDERYGGMCWSWSTGRAYCICPIAKGGAPLYWSGGYEGTGLNKGDWTNTVVHEGGGHCFGKLGDEYYSSEGYYPNSYISGHSWPVPMSLNLIANKNNVLWQHFIGLNDYPKVGLYEGGSGYLHGVWRSELISCMIDNRFYFNAPSRELIVKRIKSLAGETYSFEDFLARDVNVDNTPKVTGARTASVQIMPPTAPPMLIDNSFE